MGDRGEGAHRRAARATRRPQHFAFGFDREANLELTISYASGLTENLSFFLVAPDTKSNRRSSVRAGKE